MIYMGDEYGHTKGGNNNTYCHDNYVSPYTTYLSLSDRHTDAHRSNSKSLHVVKLLQVGQEGGTDL